MKEAHDAAKKEKITVEKNGVKIVMNGNFEVEELVLNPELRKEDQEKILIDCINDVCRKTQMALAQKFAGLAGMF